MSFKSVGLLLILIICNTSCMQPSVALHHLPPDLKRKIVFIQAQTHFGTNINRLANGILALAATSKGLRTAMNTTANIKSILAYLPYTSQKLDLIKLLQKKRATMPILQLGEMKTFFCHARKKLKGGIELLRAIHTQDYSKIHLLLTDPNININWRATKKFRSLAPGRPLPRNQSPLIRGIVMGHYPIIKILLCAGANPDSLSARGRSALSYADLESTQLLVQAGADINSKNYSGQTVLTRCTHSEIHHDKVALLLSLGANPNCQDTLGRTVLMCAACTHQKELVALLLQYDADPCIKDKEGFTALDYALPTNRLCHKFCDNYVQISQEVTELLLAAGKKKQQVLDRVYQEKDAKLHGAWKVVSYKKKKE